MKYSSRDLKGDVLAGSLNGLLFSCVYSYFYWPVDRHDLSSASCLRRSPLAYAAVNGAKLAVAFAIMRSTYNCTRKEELEEQYQLVSCGAAFALICTFI